MDKDKDKDKDKDNGKDKDNDNDKESENNKESVTAPVDNKGNKGIDKGPAGQVVNCSCGVTNNDSKPMVECSQCLEWSLLRSLVNYGQKEKVCV